MDSVVFINSIKGLRILESPSGVSSLRVGMHNNYRYIDHVLLIDNGCQKIFASLACLNHMVTSNTMAHSITNSESTEEYARKSNTRFTQSSHLQSAPVFVLCERCYWCATFLDKNRLLEEEGVEDDKSKICPRCDDIDSISSLPIVSSETFSLIIQSSEE